MPNFWYPIKSDKRKCRFFHKLSSINYYQCGYKFWNSYSFNIVSIIPVFNKGKRNKKENCRSTSIFPNVSKIFEKNFSNYTWETKLYEISNFIEPKLSKQESGFRKGYNTQEHRCNILRTAFLQNTSVSYAWGLTLDPSLFNIFLCQLPLWWIKHHTLYWWILLKLINYWETKVWRQSNED